ncbi:uncharacterized protein [Vulpes vulpes]|uniref:Uncharacterized protein isoform X1 n=2 Tax=Vulpes vulpes TaxID=9627 RepID=A0A3Q7V3W1_VULVU|nr:uncharacterized protein LOC112934979 isoform X1 [Vulpes vulpes]
MKPCWPPPGNAGPAEPLSVARANQNPAGAAPTPITARPWHEASPGFSESGAEARAVGARRRARKRVLASSTAGGRGQQVAETASLCSLCAPQSVRPSTSRDACLKSAHPDSQRQFSSFLFLLKILEQAVTTSHKNMPLAKDLLHPSPEEEKRKHKKKHLVQSPNSYFMDVKCPGCYKITTLFSHAQTVVLGVGCSTVLCQPTGGKARLTEGCSFRRKQH